MWLWGCGAAPLSRYDMLHSNNLPALVVRPIWSKSGDLNNAFHSKNDIFILLLVLEREPCVKVGCRKFGLFNGNCLRKVFIGLFPTPNFYQ